MNTGDRIKFYRKEKKLNQTELANKSGISRNALSNYELNKRKPTIEVLKKIAKALEINVIYLVEDKLKKESNSDSIISLLETKLKNLDNLDDIDKHAKQMAIKLYETLLDMFKTHGESILNKNKVINESNYIKINVDVDTFAKNMLKYFLENNLLIFKTTPTKPNAIFITLNDEDSYNNTLNASK